MESKNVLVIRSNVLRDRRLAAAFSQQTLADESNVDVGTIKQIEAAVGGLRAVFPSTVQKLAGALKCKPADVSELVTAEELVAATPSPSAEVAQ